MIFSEPVKLKKSANPRVPAPIDFRHGVDLQIRFNDIDILGHVNNAVYLSFFDLGKAEYFTEAIGMKMEIGKVGVAIVNINANFFSPTYFNEPIRVYTSVTRLSVHSFTLEQRIVNQETGDVKCTCTAVMAGFDPKKAISVPLPEEFVAKVKQFERMG